MTTTPAQPTDRPTRLPGRPWLWFDLDDTLWDFRGNSLIALEETYRHFGLSRFWPSCSAWFDDYHRVNEQLWQAYSRGDIKRQYLRMERFRLPLADAGCPDSEARQLSTDMDGYYLGLLAKMHRTVGGALDLLRRVHPLYNIGVLSNGFAEVQYGKIASAGLTAFIDCVVLSDEIEANKPNRRIFDYACAKAHTTPQQCLLVGDNPDADIAGAAGAGWQAIYYGPEASDCEIAGLENRFPGISTVRALSDIDVATDGSGTLKTPFSGLIVKKST